jgi:hypothetical protein
MCECCKCTVAGPGLLNQAVLIEPVVNIGRSDLLVQENQIYSKIFTV